MGCGPDWGEIDQNYNPHSSAGLKEVGRRMWAQAGYGPKDVDVSQIYCNMSGSSVSAMIDVGLCTHENVNEVMQLENLISPTGKLPINTGGGDLAEGFMHGMGNTLEAVRQIRGVSSNQVPNAQLSFLTSGPMSELSSTALFGTEATL